MRRSGVSKRGEEGGLRKRKERERGQERGRGREEGRARVHKEISKQGGYRVE